MGPSSVMGDGRERKIFRRNIEVKIGVNLAGLKMSGVSQNTVLLPLLDNQSNLLNTYEIYLLTTIKIIFATRD